jgi:single-strand DNA-binding protein
MGTLNKAQLIGYLGKDPEMRYLPDGTAIATVSLATSEKWTDKGGNKQERTEWHRCVFWGKLAEIAGEYLKKGSQAYVEGRIQTHKWEDKNKVTRYSTEIRADHMVMLGEPRPHEREQEPEPPPARRQATSQDYRDASRGEGLEPPPTQQEVRTLARMKDDIPF